MAVLNAAKQSVVNEELVKSSRAKCFPDVSSCFLSMQLVILSRFLHFHQFPSPMEASPIRVRYLVMSYNPFVSDCFPGQ